MLIRRILQDSGLPHAQLARDAGLSYDALRSWAVGRRSPTGESLTQLAAGMEHRAKLLEDLASELRREAEGGQDGD